MSDARRQALRGAFADVAVLVSLKALIGAFVLHCGFQQISDDDYARTVIAELFAHAPRLDPSGTSWLPLPFWVTGCVMMAAGRSLPVARATAVVLGVVSVLAPYAAMRAARVPRVSALAATALAMALPWNAWLGVAPVPEGWAGAVAAAGMIAMGEDATRGWCAVALLVASLSRYEAWPACAVLATACALEVIRTRRPWAEPRARRHAIWATIAVAGPLAWMAWNAHAHGSPTHFVARVTAFRRAIGAANIPLRDKVLGYPSALLTETPEAAALALVGAAGMCLSPNLRRRWAWPAIAAAAVFAFLIAGDVRDGAPTHHPERALSLTWWVFVAMGVDAIAAGTRALPAWPRRAAIPAACTAALAWCATLGARWAAVPGASEAERRDAQIAVGLGLRARGVEAADVTPCAYEHFAVLAAWGAPERAHVRPPTHAPVTAACPRVDEHAFAK